MKTTHRIATDQFCYVEIETYAGTPSEIALEHQSYMAAFRPQTGLPDKEYNAFIDSMLLGESNHIEQWERLSDKQKDAAQTIKRALKRLEAREGKELRGNRENE